MSRAATRRERPIGGAELRSVVEGMAAGTVVTICAATRTRRAWTVCSVGSGDFRVVRRHGDAWVLVTGPVDGLAAEVSGIPGDLESLTGVAPSSLASGAGPRLPPLSPGDVLTFADLIRRGEASGIRTACEEFALAEPPGWTAQLAWGAEAVLSLVAARDGRPWLAAMIHLLTTGWGCLCADAQDDLDFRPMSILQVQARVAAFTALLRREPP